MKKILSSILATVMLLSVLTVPAFATTTTSFDDIENVKWAEQYIMLCLQHGAIEGVRTADANGVSSFNPNANVTLGQFLTVLSRLVAADKIVEKPNAVSWASPYYDAAVASGIISRSDFKDSKESLDTPLTREEMAYILVGAAKVNGETLESLPNVETMMGDYNKIDYGYRDAVKKAYSNGLLAGGTDGNFSPTNPMTRAQMATVVCRLMEYAPRDKVTVSETPNQPDRIMGGYVSNHGQTEGMLVSEYSREYELKALDGVKLGQDSTGVYAEYTAPMLPDEIKNDFTFMFNTVVAKSNGDYFATDAKVQSVKPGETVKVYFYSFASKGTQGITKDQIDTISVGVAINNSSGRHMFIREIFSNDKTHAYGEWYNGNKETVDYNSSAIFAGIGK